MRRASRQWVFLRPRDPDSQPDAFAENVEEDLLSITAVYSMTEEAVKQLLEEAHADEAVPRTAWLSRAA